MLQENQQKDMTENFLFTLLFISRYFPMNFETLLELLADWLRNNEKWSADNSSLSYIEL